MYHVYNRLARGERVFNKDPIAEVDTVFRLFGKSRRSARAAYTRQIKAAAEESWANKSPGCLPWWRLGRPPKGEDEDPETAYRRKLAQESQGPADRPTLDVSMETIIYVRLMNWIAQSRKRPGRQQRRNGVTGTFYTFYAEASAKPLAHTTQRLWSLRVGDWRVVFALRETEIWILKIGHRRDVSADRAYREPPDDLSVSEPG